MPFDEAFRWLKEITEAFAPKFESKVWQFSAAYLTKEMVRNGHELMEEPLLRSILITTAERFDRLLDQANGDQTLAVALCRARAALEQDKFFERLPIEVQALEIYIELRGKLGRQPTDSEIGRGLAAAPGFSRTVSDRTHPSHPDDPPIERTQWRRVRRVLARVRGC
jgi:hypothetical protein